MGNLKLGIARRDISPAIPCELRGAFSRRIAKRINDPLYAKACFFDDGKTRAALVTCDLIGVNYETVTQAREKIQKKIGLSADNIIITATHTHSGPYLKGDYINLAVDGIVEAVVEAAKKTQEVRVKTARAMIYGLSFNRRHWLEDGSVNMYFGYQNPEIVMPAGPVDPMLGLFFFESRKGLPLILANFSLHPCTAGPGAISADYPAVFEQGLRATLGEELNLHFITAPCGNVNHCDLTLPEPAKQGLIALKVGARLTQAALRVYKNAKEIQAVPVKAAVQRREFTCRPYTQEELKQAKKMDLYDPATWGGGFLQATIKRRIIQIHQWGGKRKIEAQALRFGQAALAFLPGEIFVEHGMRIKKESPFYPHTYVGELSGDDIAYIPTRSAFAEGGYEVEACRFPRGCGEIMAEEALIALKELV